MVHPDNDSTAIGHPAHGYKLDLHHFNVREGGNRFMYTRADSDGNEPVWCKVLYRRGHYLFVRCTSGESIGRKIWCIHAHFRTGLDLCGSVVGEEGTKRFNPINTLDDLSAIGYPATAEGVKAAVEDGRLYPAMVGPRFGMTSHVTSTGV